MSLLQRYEHAFRQMWRAFPDLLFFDLVYKALAFIVLTPLMSWLIARLLATTGRTALSNTEILGFFLTPVGMIGMILLVAVAGAFAVMEFAGLVQIGLGAERDEQVRYDESLLFTARSIWRILGLAILQLLVLLAGILPFVIVAVIGANALIGEYDINYYLTNRPPEFRQALMIGGVLLVGAGIVTAWLFTRIVYAQANVLFRNVPVTRAIPESWARTKGQLWPMLFALGGWLLAWFLVSNLVNRVLFGFGGSAVSAARQNLILVLLILSGVAISHFLVVLAIAFVGFTGFALVVAGLFLAAHAEEEGEHAVVLPASSGEPLGDKPTWRIPKVLPLALAGVAFLFMLFFARNLIEQAKVEDEVAVTAHRGASIVAPENTMAAFEQGLADGADYVELDVQLTADGEVVVLHDADLMRMADDPSVVTETNYEDMADIELGLLHDPPFEGETMPTLAEALRLAKGKAITIVEIKRYAADLEDTAAAVVEVIEEEDMVDEAVVMSLYYDDIAAVKRLNPDIVGGVASSVELGDLTRLEDADFLALSAASANRRLIRDAQAAGKEVFVWTLNEPGDMTTFIDRGVDNIITDAPDVLVEVLRRRAEMTTFQRVLLAFYSVLDGAIVLPVQENEI